MDAAKKCLLPPTEVKSGSTIYYRSERTERGAEKAAATRRHRQEQARADKAAAERDIPDNQDSEQDNNLTFCGVCCEVYAEVRDEPEDRIQCESCLKWFHFECASMIQNQYQSSLFVTLARYLCLIILYKFFAA